MVHAAHDYLLQNADTEALGEDPGGDVRRLGTSRRSHCRRSASKLFRGGGEGAGVGAGGDGTGEASNEKMEEMEAPEEEGEAEVTSMADLAWRTRWRSSSSPKRWRR